MIERDWFAILQREIAAEAPRPARSADEVETMIADIISGRIKAPDARSRRSRRRRWIAGGTAVIVFAGGATAAALWNRRTPDAPEGGIACKASLAPVAEAAVIPPAADPIEACRQLWLQGFLPDLKNRGPLTDSAPNLFACVGRFGALEVYPNLTDPPTTCADLGLDEADTNVMQDPIVVLQSRLVTDINEVCVDMETAKQLATAALHDLGFDDWTIVVGQNGAGCVKVGVDPDTKALNLQSIPVQPTPTT